MKNFLIAGFVLLKFSLFRLLFVKYFTSFLPQAVVFRKKVLHFQVCGDDDDLEDKNDANCFSVLDSTCSRATPKTSLGRWSNANDVKKLLNSVPCGRENNFQIERIMFKMKDSAIQILDYIQMVFFTFLSC